MSVLTGPAAAAPVVVRHLSSRWQVLRVVVLVLWLAWAGCTWWIAPRAATEADFRADLTSGTVTSAYRAELDPPHGSDRSGWAPTRELPSDHRGPLFAWSTSDGREWYAAYPGRTTDVRAAFTAELEAAGLGDPWGGARGDDLSNALGTLLLFGSVLVLGVLVGGPAPRRATRWAWFWLLGLPLGVGLLAWLALDRPWSRTMDARHPEGCACGSPDTRARGLVGLVWLVLGSLLVWFAVDGLRSALGPWWIPG